MPVPKPDVGEDRNDFIQRCVSFVKNEDPNTPTDQASAICFNEWKSHVNNSVLENEVIPVQEVPKKKKGKLELLNDIKRMVEKNDIELSDEALLALMDKMVTKPGDVKTLSLTNKLEATNNEQVIQVFPRKKVFIEKYKTNINFDDKLFDQIISNFNNETLFKPFIDKDHELKESFGDITELFKNEKGLFARVKLNNLGIDAVKNGVYKYISPEWGSRSNTQNKQFRNVLWAITFTNIPALEGELPTLQDQIKLTREVHYMDYKQKLAHFEGRLNGNYRLQEGEEQSVPMNFVMEMLNALKDVTAQMEEALGAKEQVERVAEEATAELNKFKASQREKNKKEFFDFVVKEGILHPAKVTDWEEIYDTNEEWARKMLKKDGFTNNNEIQTSRQSENKSLTQGLDDLDLKIMKDRGFDIDKPEDVKLYKKSQGMED